jgi:hypothetical protein
MESLIKENLNELIVEIKDKLGGSESSVIQINDQLFTATVINIFWNMLTGSHISISDKNTRKVLQTTSDLSKAYVFNNPTIAFPVLRHIFPELSGYFEVRKLWDTQEKFLRVTKLLYFKEYFNVHTFKAFNFTGPYKRT